MLLPGRCRPWPFCFQALERESALNQLLATSSERENGLRLELATQSKAAEVMDGKIKVRVLRIMHSRTHGSGAGIRTEGSSHSNHTKRSIADRIQYIAAAHQRSGGYLP